MTPPFKLENPNAAKAAALKAARATAQPPANPNAIQKWINPADAPDRIRIVFDDSGSMSGQIENAKEGVVEFLRNCIPNQTSVAVHFFETRATKLAELDSNLMEIASLLKEKRLSLGGTPFFGSLMRVITLTPFATRLVAFTDGAPTDDLTELMKDRQSLYGMPTLSRYLANADVVIEKAKERKQPIDTVYFGSSEYAKDQITLLKYIAEKSGGFFLHFDPAKVNFRTAFKYLAPVNRLMLASESFRKEIEDGTRS